MRREQGRSVQSLHTPLCLSTKTDVIFQNDIYVLGPGEMLALRLHLRIYRMHCAHKRKEIVVLKNHRGVNSSFSNFDFTDEYRLQHGVRLKLYS